MQHRFMSTERLCSMGVLPFHLFRFLPLAAQIELTLLEGTYLGARTGPLNTEIQLYLMKDFFVEVSYDRIVQVYYHCKAFQDKALLIAYADSVDLSAFL
ncbi:hypothetical protein [Hymenobacter pini]|uniref:hypothetical protein n=1 Tax=Hymenobacter pini TaxID=2880879 RepID=UPI001CF4BAF5|nr:hypothetical protein [Hymenobacter pini]MCA8831487.1 hypothetical protein [Hymenobacter pini]